MFLHSFNVYGVKELTVRSIQRAGSTQQNRLTNKQNEEQLEGKARHNIMLYV